MMRNWGLKGVLLFVLMAVALVVGTMSTVYAGAEPGGTERIVGKSISAVLTAILVDPDGVSASGDESVVQVIAGWCNKGSFVLGPIIDLIINPDNITSIAAECSETNPNCLENYVIGASGPPGCYSDYGGEDLIITSVKNFINNGKVISAEITLQMLETK